MENIREEEDINNRLKKKREADVHNMSAEIISNTLPVGSSDCCGDSCLFMYMVSEEENIYNIYCMSCPATFDLRKIDEIKGFKPYYLIADVMRTLVGTYGEEVILRTQGKFKDEGGIE